MILKKGLFILSILIGIFLSYQGYSILTFSARGEAIYKLGLLIPAQSSSLYLYGSIFLILGLLLILIPLVLRTFANFKKPNNS